MAPSSPWLADAMLMLGLGVGIAIVVRGVSIGLHSVYRDSEVEEEPNPPPVSQGTEEGTWTQHQSPLTAQSLKNVSQDIPLSSLGMLATTHQNLEVRKAAIAILTNRFLADTTNIHALLRDARQPSGSPHQRAAELALSMIRDTHGVDLDQWDQRGQHPSRRDHHQYARQLWEVLPCSPDEHGRWEMQPSSRVPRNDHSDAEAPSDDLTPIHLTLPLLPRNPPAPDFTEADQADLFNDPDGQFDSDWDDWDGNQGLVEQHARITRSLMTAARRRRERPDEVARRRVRREAVVINNGDRPITQDDIFQRPATGAPPPPPPPRAAVTIAPVELHL
ncbi:hypothetical protein HDK77DRAFT_501002 [Phyllosticta capitalensis]